jgi:NADH-quinone oxidoreductase subunit H
MICGKKIKNIDENTQEVCVYVTRDIWKEFAEYNSYLLKHNFKIPDEEHNKLLESLSQTAQISNQYKCWNEPRTDLKDVVLDKTIPDSIEKNSECSNESCSIDESINSIKSEDAYLNGVLEESIMRERWTECLTKYNATYNDTLNRVKEALKVYNETIDFFEDWRIITVNYIQNNSYIINIFNSIELPQITVFNDILIKINYIFNNIFYNNIIFFLIKVICILLTVAYFTLAERKAMASIQRRRGPNVVGLWGLLQPIADGVKLIFKEMIIPTRSNSRTFILAPLVILVLSFFSWNLIPFQSFDVSKINYFDTNLFSNLIFYSDYINNKANYLIFETFQWKNIIEYSNFANISYGILFILAISSLNVYGIIIAGWASNSKYAFLGSLRSAAQMISYEVSLGLVILPVILLSGSMNFTEIVLSQKKTVWYVFPLLPCAIIFLISMIAETNRAPFDLPEAEAELVAGYNVEYSSFTFAMFFLGEYSNMLLMATLATIFFFGGWSMPIPIRCIFPTPFLFSIKIVFFCFFFIWVRATLPRYRYDQLMDIGWKIFLPISFGYLIFVAGILIAFNGLPFISEVYTPFFSENIIYDNTFSHDYSEEKLEMALLKHEFPMKPYENAEFDLINLDSPQNILAVSDMMEEIAWQDFWEDFIVREKTIDYDNDDR